jgi:dihydrolipoamide dehydrogenase
LTPEQALALPTLPSTLSVYGNDYIALELATLFARLGVAVKLHVPGDRLLNNVDPAALRLVQAGLRKLGVQVMMQITLADCTERPLVISNGAQPRTAGLHPEVAGLHINEVGAIAVNTMQQSNLPHVYAVGDCTGSLSLANIAIKQGKVAAEVASGQRTQFAPLVIPLVVHTTPELATVGYSAEEAVRAGYKITTGRFPLAANGRALSLSTDSGVALVVANAENETLLGATLVGPRAGDLIGQVALAIEMGATLTDLTEVLYAHPSLSEIIQESAEQALGQAIHLLTKSPQATTS